MYRRDQRESVVEFLFRFKLFFLTGRVLDRPFEQQDVRLRLVDQVVDPSVRLLDTQSSPLALRHQMCFGDEFRDFFGQNDVPANVSSVTAHNRHFRPLPVLELVVVVLLRVVDLLVGHCVGRGQKWQRREWRRSSSQSLSLLLNVVRHSLTVSIPPPTGDPLLTSLTHTSSPRRESCLSSLVSPLLLAVAVDILSFCLLVGAVVAAET